MHWLCSKSGVGRAGFPCEACQEKPLQLPLFGPEKPDVGFWLGARQLSSVYVNNKRDKTLAN